MVVWTPLLLTCSLEFGIGRTPLPVETYELVAAVLIVGS